MEYSEWRITNSELNDLNNPIVEQAGLLASKSQINDEKRAKKTLRRFELNEFKGARQLEFVRYELEREHEKSISELGSLECE